MAGAEAGPGVRARGWDRRTKVEGGLGKTKKRLKDGLVLSIDFINLCNLCPPLPRAMESWLRFLAAHVPLSPFSLGKICLETWADGSPRENSSSLGRASVPWCPPLAETNRETGSEKPNGLLRVHSHLGFF